MITATVLAVALPPVLLAVSSPYFTRVGNTLQVLAN